MSIIFDANSNGDNGPALSQLLADGERHIQINGETCPIGTPIVLGDASGPFHDVRIEPAEGIEKVEIDLSGIGLDILNLTNPSFAAFDYNGNFRAASGLSAAVSAGATSVTVVSASPYAVDDYIFISDASVNPAYRLPVDGPCEVRRIVSISGNTLTLESSLQRSHPLQAAVVLCDPIRNLHFERLHFSGLAAAGIHVHCAQRSVFKDITADNFTGRVMLLIDAGGLENLVLDCYCEGTVADIAPGQTVWGVALEGQDRSVVIRSGGERCGVGLALNYCIDTVAVTPTAKLCTVNVGIYTQSIRTRMSRPLVSSPLALNSVITPDCLDCLIA